MRADSVFCIDINGMKALDISPLEWVFLCIVGNLEDGGVCDLPKDELAEIVGVARRSVFNMIDRLCEKKLLKKRGAGIATTAKWKNAYEKIENRIEKSKPKEQPKKKDKFDELLSQIPKEKRDGYKEIHIKILRDFYEYRKNIKPIKTPRPLEMYLNELKKIQDAGYKPMEAIETMKSREWQTVKLEWIEREKGIEKRDAGSGGNYTW